MPSHTTPPCGIPVHLRDLQHKLVSSILHHQPSLLFVAGTGSGKTISAIVAGVCALTNGRVNGVVIVTPTGVHAQFANEVRRLVPSEHQHAFEMHTHHKFFHHDTPLKELVRGKLLVVDEAHALATTIVRDRGTGEVASGKMAYHATVAAGHAAQVLLLTATPVKNAPSELFNLLCMVQQQPYERFYRDHAMYRTELDKLFREYLRTGNEYLLQRRRRKNLLVQAYVERIHPYIMFAHCSREGFPTCEEKTVRLTMDSEYLKLYNKVEQEQVEEAFHEVLDRDASVDTGVPLQLLFDPNKASCFFSKVRVAVNGITEYVTSAKVDYALDVAYAGYKRKQRVLLYSTFLNGGLSLIARELRHRDVPYVQIDGSVSATDRRVFVEMLNRGDVFILLISAAGSEGLDLKGVRDVIVLEPHFHDVRIEQVIGRAVRYKSHTHLPADEQHVTVHRLLLCKPTEAGETWEAIERFNLRAVRRLIEKHAGGHDIDSSRTHHTRHTRRHTRRPPSQPIHLYMHPMYKALVQNILLTLNIPQNRFRLFTQRTDHKMIAEYPPNRNPLVRSLTALTKWFRRPLDVIELKQPPTDISVDDLLHRLSQHKKRFLGWHLGQIRRGSGSGSGSGSRSRSHRRRRFISDRYDVS